MELLETGWGDVRSEVEQLEVRSVARCRLQQYLEHYKLDNEDDDVPWAL